MELTDQKFRNTLRLLGDREGLGAGKVRVELNDGQEFTAETTACTWLGDLGLVARLPRWPSPLLPGGLGHVRRGRAACAAAAGLRAWHAPQMRRAPVARVAREVLAALRQWPAERAGFRPIASS